MQEREWRLPGVAPLPGLPPLAFDGVTARNPQAAVAALAGTASGVTRQWLWLTVLIRGRALVQVSLQRETVGAVAVALLVAPLLLAAAGYLARRSAELMPEHPWVAEVGARTAPSSNAAFTIEPGLRQTLWQVPARRRAAALGLGTAPVASKLLAALPRPEWVAAANGLAEPESTLEWPVPDGWFVRGYGSGDGGYHLAVDVAAEPGSDVVAVAPGIVGYAGNQIRGYGNIVLLIHPGGWVSLYAHNRRNHVVAGQAVRRGDMIAEVGSTGISRGPHVHFEFLVDGNNCDPLGLFRPFARHREGQASQVPQLQWQAGTPRPRGLKCGRRRRKPSSPSHSPVQD